MVDFEYYTKYCNNDNTAVLATCSVVNVGRTEQVNTQQGSFSLHNCIADH